MITAWRDQVAKLIGRKLINYHLTLFTGASLAGTAAPIGCIMGGLKSGNIPLNVARTAL